MFLVLSFICLSIGLPVTFFSCDWLSHAYLVLPNCLRPMFQVFGFILEVITIMGFMYTLKSWSQLKEWYIFEYSNRYRFSSFVSVYWRVSVSVCVFGFVFLFVCLCVCVCLNV